MEKLWCASLVLYFLLFLSYLALGTNGEVGSTRLYSEDQRDKSSNPQPAEVGSGTDLWPNGVESDPSLTVQLYGGDIILSEDQRAILERPQNPSNPNGPKRAVVSSGTDLWPDGIVPYELDPSLSMEAELVIEAAIEEYTVTTCIRFRLRYVTDIHYVKFYNGDGCFSQIGRSGGEQVISIGSNCVSKGIAMHEMFHALGRWHEQSRPDRDRHVQIHYDNIKSGFESNFEQISQVLVTTQGIPYDYDSIMHYESNAFSQNGEPTIEPLDNRVAVNRLGQRTGFSTLDISHINALYCGGPIGEWSVWGSWSPCSATCNGGTQTRTRTCLNGLDCAGTNIDRMRCSEENCPILAQWGVWGEWSGCSQSCGGGRRTRLRRCQNGENCIGNRQDYEDCNTQDCPFVQRWGSWSVWSECSQTCTGGTRYRTRVCISNTQCAGADVHNELCNTNITCEPVIGEWSPCSMQCGTGGGLQFRTVGKDIENRTCSEQSCHSEHCLAGVSHIGCYTLEKLQIDFYAIPLSDVPPNHQSHEPVRTCAEAASNTGNSLFGLSNGTCYYYYNNSGSEELQNYSSRNWELQNYTSQSWLSDLCYNGNGGNLSIDMYQITDELEFESSSRSIESCGSDYCIEELTICSGATRSCNVNVLLQLVAVLFVLSCVYSCR